MATFANLEAQLAAADGVIASYTSKSPTQAHKAPDGIYVAQISHAVEVGQVAELRTATALVKNFGLVDEEAWWFNGLPEVLKTAAPTVYFSARTVGTVTAAQIEAFCNATWKSLPNQSAAPDIREFSVVPVDGKTVRFEGYLNTGAAGALWTHKKYFIRLVDPNGSVSVGNANIKFEAIE